MKRFLKIGSLVIAAGSLLAQMKPPAAGFMDFMTTSMKKMNHDMVTAPMSGDVDHDFATMMIPHHQGAIDMAKAELSYGKDTVLRRIAQEIIVSQQSEIDVLRLQLRKEADRARTEKE